MPFCSKMETRILETANVRFFNILVFVFVPDWPIFFQENSRPNIAILYCPQISLSQPKMIESRKRNMGTRLQTLLSL